MKQIPNKEYEKYQQYLSDKTKSRILTPEALRFICEANHYDAAAIGQYFLELLPTICAGRTADPEYAPDVASNKYWLCAETEAELTDLLDMFWGFHDFRIEKIEYSAAPDCIDVLLEYDTHDIHILLRFIGNVSMNFIAGQEYGADWLMSTSLGIGKNGQVAWAGADDLSIKELPSDVLWILGDKLHYAYLGNDGQPMPLPDDILHQVWHQLNYETGNYEDSEHDFHPRYLLS
jgi:hypothetical protein